MIVEKGGRVDVLDFANRLHTWMTQGFKELGDIGKFLLGDKLLVTSYILPNRWNGNWSNHKESADPS